MPSTQVDVATMKVVVKQGEGLLSPGRGEADCVCDAVDNPTKHRCDISKMGVTAKEIFHAVRFLPDYVVGVVGPEDGINAVEELLHERKAHGGHTLAERDEIADVHLDVVDTGMDVVVRERCKVLGQRCFFRGNCNTGRIRVQQLVECECFVFKGMWWVGSFGIGKICNAFTCRAKVSSTFHGTHGKLR